MPQTRGTCGHLKSVLDNHLTCLKCYSCSRFNPCEFSSVWDNTTWCTFKKRRLYSVKMAKKKSTKRSSSSSGFSRRPSDKPDNGINLNSDVGRTSDTQVNTQVNTGDLGGGGDSSTEEYLPGMSPSPRGTDHTKASNGDGRSMNNLIVQKSMSTGQEALSGSGRSTGHETMSGRDQTLDSLTGQKSKSTGQGTLSGHDRSGHRMMSGTDQSLGNHTRSPGSTASNPMLILAPDSESINRTRDHGTKSHDRDNQSQSGITGHDPPDMIQGTECPVRTNHGQSLDLQYHSDDHVSYPYTDNEHRSSSEDRTMGDVPDNFPSNRHFHLSVDSDADTYADCFAYLF